MPLIHSSPVRRLSFAAGISMLAFCAALPALAADIVAASKIEAVTVYPDAAQVSRQAKVDVPAGTHSIVLEGLPYGLDPNSLRVEAEGGASLVIGSVSSRIVAAVRPAVDAPVAEKLRLLVEERQVLQQKLNVLSSKTQMIRLYAKASPEKLGEKAAPMAVGDWSKAWDAVATGLNKIAEDNVAIRARQREVAQEIRALRQANRGPAAGARSSRTVSVDVEAGAAASVNLTLTYRVRGARWLPVYDARLETGGKAGAPSLELIRRASVRQNTGEDWSGVALRVSTVRANRGTQAPNLLAQRLEFYNPPPAPAPVARAPAEKRRQFSRGGILGLQSMSAGRADAAAKPAVEQEAALNAGAYEAQFRIPGRVDLNSDNAARVLRIASSKIAPQMLVRAVPALDSTAYLEASFVNKDEAALLPGIVNIHRNGLFAGRGRIKLVAPGDTAMLGFGADDSVKIKRLPVSRKQSGPGWIGNNRNEVTNFSTTVTNLHGFAIKVRIIDRIPISEDDKIIIKPLPGNTDASSQNADGRRGVLAWDFDLKPKASKQIRLGWQVEWPNGKRIVPRNLPN